MVAAVFAQMVMVMLMVMTSVHLRVLQHPLKAVSLVISSHTLGMYAFAIVSGRLTDRRGRGLVIILGSIILVGSCLMAAPSTTLFPLLIALFLLGVGWSPVYVVESALPSDAGILVGGGTFSAVREFIVSVEPPNHKVGLLPRARLARSACQS